MLHLLRGQAGQVAAPFIGFQQDLVAQHIQLLLRLALDVAGAGIAQHAAQSAFADRGGNGFAGPGDHFQQQAQIGVDMALMLGLDQVARQGDRFHAWIPCKRVTVL